MKEFPDWFGNMGASAYTLFQVMTLEGWVDGVTRPLSEWVADRADRLVLMDYVDNAAGIVANAKTTKDWPSYGLDYAETRFSKLDQINTDNVKQLGLKWSYNLGSERGVEATPVVVDGIMYVTASWSVVHAIDTRTGKKLWTFDPKVDHSKGYRGCCDVVNRGVALYKGKVFVGAYDGRLIALDAATGNKAWEIDTLIEADDRQSRDVLGDLLRQAIVAAQGAEVTHLLLRTPDDSLAAEAAARAGKFGPLPQGFTDDVLPVIFSFDPKRMR